MPKLNEHYQDLKKAIFLRKLRTVLLPTRPSIRMLRSSVLESAMSHSR